MIWDDPWAIAAMAGGTMLPPLNPPLKEGQRLEVLQSTGLVRYIHEWIQLVGTQWMPHELLERLAGAWIPCLFQDSTLVATCVLRPTNGMWILETLRGQKGFGTPLIRAVVSWIYSHDGPFSLGYTWELGIAGLIGAWARGWLGSAEAIHYGWSWSSSQCGFCPSWHPPPRFVLPTLFQSESGMAIVSDSGLRDGWGNVLTYKGNPDWHAIALEGRWKALWMHAPSGPKEWTWTGEFVVVGVINKIHGTPNIEWITAEIGSR